MSPCPGDSLHHGAEIVCNTAGRGGRRLRNIKTSAGGTVDKPPAERLRGYEIMFPPTPLNFSTRAVIFWKTARFFVR